MKLVLMGVAGCGKSSVGAALAPRIAASYRDGDDLHPQANIDKMAAGVPLTDADRWPWLKLVGQTLAAETRIILGCSALKRHYRDLIRDTAAAPVIFIHLAGHPDLIAARMQARPGHFMPATLLASQLAALEPLQPDEAGFSVAIDQPLPSLLAAIENRLRQV